MGDPLSVVAGVLGVATSAIQVSKGLYELVDSIKNAPDEIQTVSRDTQSLYGVIYSLHHELQSPDIRNFVAQDAGLTAIVGSLQKPLQNSTVILGKIMVKIRSRAKTTGQGYRIGTLDLKWGFYMKNEVGRLMLDLAATKNTLDVALTSITVICSIRLVSMGLQPVDKPIGSNDTDAGFALRRYVEESISSGSVAPSSPQVSFMYIADKIQGDTVPPLAELKEQLEGLRQVSDRQETSRMSRSSTPIIVPLSSLAQEAPQTSPLSTPTISLSSLIELSSPDIAPPSTSLADIFPPSLSGPEPLIPSELSAAISPLLPALHNVTPILESSRELFSFSPSIFKNFRSKSLKGTPPSDTALECYQTRSTTSETSSNQKSVFSRLKRFRGNALKSSDPIPVLPDSSQPSRVPMKQEQRRHIAKPSSVDERLLQRARHNDDASVLMLLSVGADVNTTSNKGQSPLHIALEHRRHHVSLILLDHDADPNLHEAFVIEGKVVDERGLTPLMWAALQGFDIVISRLLALGANVDVANRHGLTALHIAAHAGFSHCAQLLLDGGASSNARDGMQRSPIHYAVGQKDKGIIKLLLESGAETEGVDTQGHTPLETAIDYRVTGSAEALILGGANFRRHDEAALQPIHRAARNGACGIVALLIRCGVHVDSVTEETRTSSLFIAVAAEQEEMVLLLLDWGAKINANYGDHGETPLSKAVSTGNTNIVQLLLKRGAKIDVRNDCKCSDCVSKADQTPLFQAVIIGDLAMTKILILAGADVNVENGEFKRTSLKQAVLNKDVDIVNLLTQKGADVETLRDKTWRTPLLSAALGGADLNMAVGLYQETPLAQAIQDRDIRVVELLIQKGADVNKESGPMQRTPLVRAIATKQLSSIRLLLDKGADVHLPCGKDDMTPWLQAVQIGHEVILELLLKETTA